MVLHTVRKGLDLPIDGEPEQVISAAARVERVALLARDYVGIKPRLLVQAGQAVTLGEPLFEDRSNPGVRFVAPGTGTVAEVNRGERRVLHSVVIVLTARDGPCAPFAAYRPDAGDRRETAVALLLESGLWTALRERPFSSVARPTIAPHAVFVTAVDTHPLAPRPDVALAGREGDFERGVAVLGMLTDGPVYVCRAPGSRLGDATARATVEEFTGKHPAGTVGYHIHVLDPVRRGKTVFHAGYQDVVRIGHLFATGTLDPRCVVSLAGPLVKRPRLVETRLGASTDELVAEELREGEARVVSGSVLHGDRAAGAHAFLGRYHNQVTVLAEGRDRELLGWLRPGARRFSIIPTFLSALLPRRRFALDTNAHGSRRAMIPIGLYERVMPMDLMPTHLLRALAVGDVEWAEELGALELDEEDLALCTFVCPSKYDYGPALRRVLTTLEKGG